MLFLLFVYFSLSHGSVDVGALPISNSNNTVSGFEASTCLDINHCRTLSAIAKSCVATIFACTWVSVHRNMPAPNSRWHTVTLERIWITIVALIAPEWILAWAIRQYLMAGKISRRLQIVSERNQFSGRTAEKATQTSKEEQLAEDEVIRPSSDGRQEPPDVAEASGTRTRTPGNLRALSPVDASVAEALRGVTESSEGIRSPEMGNARTLSDEIDAVSETSIAPLITSVARVDSIAGKFRSLRSV